MRKIARFLRWLADMLCPPEMVAGPYVYRVSADTDRVIRAMRRGQRSRIEPLTGDEDTQEYKPVK